MTAFVGVRYWIPLVALCLLAMLSWSRNRDKVGKAQATVPVTGRVRVNGQTLRLKEGVFGRIWFYPNSSKGNPCREVPCGEIDDEGGYYLTTAGEEGAPLGWYRIMVVASTRSDESHPKEKRRSYVPPRFSSVATSGLEVEVVAEPGAAAYDLNLRR